jgi:hypothetical protein
VATGAGGAAVGRDEGSASAAVGAGRRRSGDGHRQFAGDLRNVTGGTAFSMEPSHYAPVREEVADLR